jgi:hypothetical protein
LYHRLEKSLDGCINWVAAEVLIWMEAWFVTLLVFEAETNVLGEVRPALTLTLATSYGT